MKNRIFLKILKRSGGETEYKTLNGFWLKSSRLVALVQ